MLLTVILDDNNLEEVGLIMLIKGLEGDKNLKKISLKNTQLSSIGLTSLLKMLDKVKDFRELHLENNTIEDSYFRDMRGEQLYRFSYDKNSGEILIDYDEYSKRRKEAIENE